MVGVTVGVGTDGVSASGNLDLKRQMDLAAGLFKDARMDPTAVGAERAGGVRPGLHIDHLFHRVLARRQDDHDPDRQESREDQTSHVGTSLTRRYSDPTSR